MVPKPDWTEAISHLRNADPVLAALIDRYELCALMPDTDYFSSLSESIICQQISSKAGESIVRRFRALFPGGQPTPEGVSNLDEASLRSAGLSPQKMRYLKDLARKCLDGTIDLARLDQLPEEEIARQLRTVKGVGEWTVTMFLIFALNRTDVLPVWDLGLRRAVQLAYGLEALPDRGKLVEIARPWHPYETIATWYLWRSLENKKDPGREGVKQP
ncbi:MAG: DNA-3-methyladenine glycosylase family protein [Syntrophothermus sp.]